MTHAWRKGLAGVRVNVDTRPSSEFWNCDLYLIDTRGSSSKGRRSVCAANYALYSYTQYTYHGPLAWAQIGLLSIALL